jgi:hypothetical protein
VHFIAGIARYDPYILPANAIFKPGNKLNVIRGDRKALSLILLQDVIVAAKMGEFDRLNVQDIPIIQA